MRSFSWLLGIAAAALIAVVVWNGIRTEGPGSRGVPLGERLPPFAAPLATSRVEADANIAQRANSGAEGRRPACEVRGPEILNVCQLAERGPVALAFFVTRSQRCERQVDVLDRVARRHPGVQVAAVGVRGRHDDVRRVVRERGWRLPVAWDRDGAVANRYAVAVCPTITFAGREGRVVETSFTLLSAAELSRKLGALGAG